MARCRCAQVLFRSINHGDAWQENQPGPDYWGRDEVRLELWICDYVMSKFSGTVTEKRMIGSSSIGCACRAASRNARQAALRKPRSEE
jgi:hypothetical protein